jgi:hypothetical protein
MAAIERDLSGSFNRCRDRSEDVLPNAALAPARKAIVDSLVWSIFRWAVLPATSYLLAMHDAAQNPPVILALRARRFVGKCTTIFAHCSSLNQNKSAFIGSVPSCG